MLALVPLSPRPISASSECLPGACSTAGLTPALRSPGWGLTQVSQGTAVPTQAIVLGVGWRLWPNSPLPRVVWAP